MKKIIAILLVLSMMFAFVACKNDDVDSPETTTGGQGEELTSDQAVNSGQVEESTTFVEESSTEEVSTSKNEELVTDKKEETVTNKKEDNKKETTTAKAPSDDPADWSKAEIVEFYKQAAIKSHPTAESSQTMEMSKLVVNDGDGALNFFLNMIKPAISTVIKNNTATYNGLTGGFTKLQPSDVKSAKAYKDGNYTVIEMYMVEQTDGMYGEAQEGTVGHAINVLGNIATAVEQFPQFDINYKEADIKILYDEPTVKVRINEKGIIEKGTWSYNSVITIRHLEISGIMIDKADAEIKYIIVVGGGF